MMEHDEQQQINDEALQAIQEELDRMDYPGLQSAQKVIADALKRREKEARQQAQRELKEVAERYGLNLNEIVQGGGQKQGSTKRKVPPKFRHPDDSSKTWTGRGRKPKWVQAWEDEGGSIEDLRITESEATE